jgi:hypothetical protein
MLDVCSGASVLCWGRPTKLPTPTIQHQAEWQNAMAMFWGRAAIHLEGVPLANHPIADCIGEQRSQKIFPA